MTIGKPIKTFSLSKINYCQSENVDIVMFVHNKNAIYPFFHNHDFYELTFVSSGEIKHYINDEMHVMKKNDLCLLAPDIIHQQIPNTDDTTIFSFGIKVEYLKKLVSCLDLELNKTILKNPVIELHYSQSDTSDFTQLLSNIGFEHISTPSLFGTPAYSKVLKVAITELLLKIFRLESNTLDKGYHPLVSTFLKEISTPSNFNYSLIELCARSNLSHGHITHLFKKANLDPPSKIFLKNKLQHACFLLQNSDMKILDVMETCGIYSTSYFNKVFKKEFGLSPSIFRSKTSTQKIQNIYLFKKI